ncbi:MAG TPA: TIR domain-containing protein [Saprospiraceae bacterium]|nr:TIR domain-containing protein [Saprospiraceae bacterium]
MDYEFDIFISYRRGGLTRKWVTDIFIPLLNDIIFLELGKEPLFYLDTQLEVGVAWPLSLGKALSKSKVIIPLWSVTYMESNWCKCEISHMLEREVKTGFKTFENNKGLVFPTIINDGENLPISISFSQKADVKNFYVPVMNMESKSAEDFYRVLQPYGISIAKSIKNAPTWKEDWGIESMNEFFKLFNQLNPAPKDQPIKFTTI